MKMELAEAEGLAGAAVNLASLPSKLMTFMFEDNGILLIDFDAQNTGE